MSRPARRVLIVTNAFPPTILADMHRARMLASDLQGAGWEVEVIAPGVLFQRPIWVEPESRSLLPEGVTVHETEPLACDGLLRTIGIRSVGWRALVPMYRQVLRVLQESRFDLIYISTTQFNFFCLGRLWRRKFRVPYVLDFHDPWFRPTRKYNTTKHNLKLRFSNWLSRSLERFAVEDAAGLVSVSSVYLGELEKRYRDFKCVRPDRCAVIPFGATVQDFKVARAQTGGKVCLRNSKLLEVVYFGAGSSFMVKSLRRIAEGLARIRRGKPDLVNRVRILLRGTDMGWAPGMPKTLQEVAHSVGVGDLVEEQPERVGYLLALNILSEAKGVLILGVDDPAYVPSKLFTYALTGKPLLACMHQRSEANRYFQELPGLGHLLTFDDEGNQDVDAPLQAFLEDMAANKNFERSEMLSPYLAKAVAQRHSNLFETCLQ